MDYIAVTSSLRLEDALTRAKLIFARGFQYIMAAVAEDGVCCSNTIYSKFDRRMLCSLSMIEIPPVLLQKVAMHACPVHCGCSLTNIKEHSREISKGINSSSSILATISAPS